MNQIAKSCQEILDFFNQIPYGVISDEKLYTGNQLTDKIFWQKWKLLTPLEVINFNGGICWDVSSAIKMFLDEMQFENYEIYCQMNNKEKASHSFNIVYQNDETCYIIDGAWKRFNKITKTESVYKCCDIMADRMFEQHGDANKITFYCLNQHKPYFGCNCQQYMQIAKQNQKLMTFTIRTN